MSDPVNDAVLRAVLSLWDGQLWEVRDAASTDGRLWMRWVITDPDDPEYGWNDWTLVDPDSEWYGKLVEAEVKTLRQINRPFGKLTGGSLVGQWCRTNLPDGPHTERLGDIGG